MQHHTIAGDFEKQMKAPTLFSIFRTAGLLSALLLFLPWRYQAEASEHIAVIEDGANQILPAAGFCPNIFYPRGICLPQAGQAFFTKHPDEFDALIFVTTKVLGGLVDNKAAAPLKSDIGGIGWDTGPYHYQDLGSDGRLMVAVTLGSLSSLPDNPLEHFTYPPIRGLEVAAHEIAHRWLSYIMVDLGDGQGSRDILRDYPNNGPGNHWSCWFNTKGSIQYGGILSDNGDGSYTDTPAQRRFSQLDQYLMGIRPPEEVDPMWYVRVGYSLHGCADLPGAPGSTSTFEGERVDFTIDDVIRAMGPRTPSVSPCHLKVGFALVHPPGQAPSHADLEKMDAYRLALQNWWDQASDGRGSLDTRLDGCGTGTAGCSGQASPQCEATPDGDGIIDGDEAVDGDDSPDGDMAIDGDLVPDGDPAIDGDMAPDGDTQILDGDLPPVDGDAILPSCQAGALQCDELGYQVIRCRDDGSGWEISKDCYESGSSCLEGACLEPEGEDGQASGGCRNTEKSDSQWFLCSILFLLLTRRRGWAT